VSEFADILAQAQLPETSVGLCLRRDLTGRFRELERRLQTANTVAASLGERAESSVVAEEMEALRKEMADREVTFQIRALPALEWARFTAKLPQRAKDEEPDEFAAKRFYPAIAGLVSRCVVDPVMTVDQVNELVDVLSGGDWNLLSSTVWAINDDREGVPFSVAAYAMTHSEGGL
jgi:hypothetical protein